MYFLMRRRMSVFQLSSFVTWSYSTTCAVKASTSPSLTAFVIEVRNRASRVDGKVTSRERAEAGQSSSQPRSSRRWSQWDVGLTLLCPLLQQVLGKHDILLCERTKKNRTEPSKISYGCLSYVAYSLNP
jgi:hypothetical protein